MKVKYNINFAIKDLKETIKFFNNNKKCRTYGGEEWMDNTPLKLVSIELILGKLKELHDVYKNNHQNMSCISVSHDINMYEVLVYIAKYENVQEIVNLDFTKKEFEEIANYILEERKKMNY